LSAHPTASGHFPVRLDSYIIKSAYFTFIPMDAFEKRLENATAKGANIVPGAVLAIVDRDHTLLLLPQDKFALCAL
jgi:hypothetical protein